MTYLIAMRALVHGLACGCERVARGAPRVLAAATTSLGIVGLLLTNACYAYEAKAPAELVQGQVVDVTVNNIGRVALTADLGDDVAQVEGTVVAVSDSALHLRVTSVEYLNGTSSTYPESDVGVPRNAVTAVRSKQFSKAKTMAVGVGLAAALIAGIKAFGLGGIGGSEADPKPGTGLGAQ